METVTCAECGTATDARRADRWVHLSKAFGEAMWFCPTCRTNQANLERLEQLEEKYPVPKKTPWHSKR